MRWVPLAVALVAISASASAALPPFSFDPILSMTDPGKPHPEIEARYTAAFKACLAPAFSNMDMQACDGDEMTRQDATLNAVWKSTLVRFQTPLRIAELRRAERMWIGGREKHCQKASREAEGTLSGVLYGQCMIDETIRRTIWLENLR
jgi:uncharacterized protein YecT (DUF1311 family)